MVSCYIKGLQNYNKIVLPAVCVLNGRPLASGYYFSVVLQGISFVCCECYKGDIVMMDVIWPRLGIV